MISIDYYEKLKAEELIKIKDYVGEAYYNSGKFDTAVKLFDEFLRAEQFNEFLTNNAYELI